TKITEVVLSLRILGNSLPILRKRQHSCMTDIVDLLYCNERVGSLLKSKINPGRNLIKICDSDSIFSSEIKYVTGFSPSRKFCQRHGYGMKKFSRKPYNSVLREKL
ncbi:hypothetical protein L9F63_008546, partial [Diploptera punctata]